MKISIILQFGTGIGHLARVSAIANELIKFAEVTVFSGGRTVEFEFNKAVEFVQLPPLDWKWDSELRLIPAQTGLSLDECLTERSNILVEWYRSELPDVVITEYFPFSPGRFGSTLDALMDEIRISNPRPLMLCSVRAFPKATHFDSQVSPHWINKCLREDYDAILHHVDPRVIPLASLDPYLSTAFSGIPVYQTGFTRKQIPPPPAGRPKGVLLTVGGGNSTSAAMLRKWIESIAHISKDLYPVYAVCGPLMSPEDRASIHGIRHDALVLYDSVANLDTLMQQCRVIVSMGGYNTLIEALSLRKPVLSFADSMHHDQHLQIDRFADIGLLVKGNNDWSAAEIAAAIEALVDFSPSGDIATDGVPNTARILQEMWHASRGHLASHSEI